MWHMPHVRISGADASHISRNSWGRFIKALSRLTLMEECNGSWPKSVFSSFIIMGTLATILVIRRGSALHNALTEPGKNCMAS